MLRFFFVASLAKVRYIKNGQRPVFDHRARPDQKSPSVERQPMAAPQFTSGERQEIYRHIFLLNRSFHLIVQRLEALGKTSILNARDLRDMLGLTQEVQLGINTGLLDQLDPVENDDWAQFGKVRIAMEKRLKTPLPERRRKH
jgi:hypothetical protein